MPTLQEILNNSYAEKTASVQEQPQYQQESAPVSDEETVKLATELGIYAELFPDDSQNEKTAEEEKIAEYQECLGARAYDYCALRFDQRMSKIAGEIMSAADMEAAQGIMQPSNRPPVAISTNQDPMGDKMPMAVQKSTPYAVQAGAEHGAVGQVGHEEQKVANATAGILALLSGR